MFLNKTGEIGVKGETLPYLKDEQHSKYVLDIIGEMGEWL
jgi:hypothetical protein